MTLTERIKEVAVSSGLDLVGIASADAFEGYAGEIQSCEIQNFHARSEVFGHCGSM